MHWNNMSTVISLVQTAFSPVLDLSLLNAVQIVLAAIVIAALLVLFKPLLLGLGRAFVLLVKPRPSKEERLALKTAMAPVHVKMADRVGKDMLQSIYKGVLE